MICDLSVSWDMHDKQVKVFAWQKGSDPSVEDPLYMIDE